MSDREWQRRQGRKKMLDKTKVERRAEIKIESKGKDIPNKSKLSHQRTLIFQSADSTLSPVALKTAWIINKWNLFQVNVTLLRGIGSDKRQKVWCEGDTARADFFSSAVRRLLTPGPFEHLINADSQMPNLKKNRKGGLAWITNAPTSITLSLWLGGRGKGGREAFLDHLSLSYFFLFLSVFLLLPPLQCP